MSSQQQSSLFAADADDVPTNGGPYAKTPPKRSRGGAKPAVVVTSTATVEQLPTTEIRCNWPGCHTSSKWYMCLDHWHRVPFDLWSSLSRVPGGSPAEYTAAHNAIQEWIAEQGEPSP